MSRAKMAISLINGALQRMEDLQYKSLGLPPGSRVFGTGCSVGHVASRFARKDLRLRQEACELRAETRRTPDTFLRVQARAKTDGL